MKRKPLKYEEQRWLVQFHNHQDHFQDMMYHPHYVSLPEAVVTTPSMMEDTTKAEEEGSLTDVPKENSGRVTPANTSVPTSSASVNTTGVAAQQPSGTNVNLPQVNTRVSSSSMPTQVTQQGQFATNPGIQRPPIGHMMIPVGRGMGRGTIPINRIQPGVRSISTVGQLRLEQIRAANLQQQQQHIRSVGGIQYPPGAGGAMMANPPPNYRTPMNALPQAMGHDTSQLSMQQQMMIRHHQQLQQRRMMMARMQQQQRQRAAMMQAAGYQQQQQQQQYAMRAAVPMQANPPMQMQQVMQPQQPQYVQQPPPVPGGGIMMRVRPAGQPMAYQPAGMNPNMSQQPPLYR